MSCNPETERDDSPDDWMDETFGKIRRRRCKQQDCEVTCDGNCDDCGIWEEQDVLAGERENE